MPWTKVRREETSRVVEPKFFDAIPRLRTVVVGGNPAAVRVVLVDLHAGKDFPAPPLELRRQSVLNLRPLCRHLVEEPRFEKRLEEREELVRLEVRAHRVVVLQEVHKLVLVRFYPPAPGVAAAHGDEHGPGTVTCAADARKNCEGENEGAMRWSANGKRRREGGRGEEAREGGGFVSETEGAALDREH